MRLEDADIARLDVHTHNLSAPPGQAVISLPKEALLSPADFKLREGCLYSAGVHPWWTDGACPLEDLLQGVRLWSAQRQVVAIGECGLDRLRGGAMAVQTEAFRHQAELAQAAGLPVIVHCVKAFDLLLSCRKQWKPSVKWIVHGFRGRPALARQLLEAGMALSFGRHYNEESFRLTPPGSRFRETDEDY